MGEDVSEVGLGGMWEDGSEVGHGGTGEDRSEVEQAEDRSEVESRGEAEGRKKEEESVEPDPAEVQAGGESGDEKARTEKVNLMRVLGIDRLVNVFSKRERSDSQASDGETQGEAGGGDAGGVGKEERKAFWKVSGFEKLGISFSQADTESEEETAVEKEGMEEKVLKASEGETQGDVGKAVWIASGFKKLGIGFSQEYTESEEEERAVAMEGTGEKAPKASDGETQGDVGGKDEAKAVWKLPSLRKHGRDLSKMNTERKEEEKVDALEEGVLDKSQSTGGKEQQVSGAAVAGKAHGGAAKAGRFAGLQLLFSRGRNGGGGEVGGGEPTGEREESREVAVEEAGPGEGAGGSHKSWRSRKTRQARRVSQGRPGKRRPHRDELGGGDGSGPCDGDEVGGDDDVGALGDPKECPLADDGEQ